MTGTNTPFVTLTDTVNWGFGQGTAGKVRSLTHLAVNMGLVAGTPPSGLFAWLGLPHNMVAGIQD